MDDFRNSQIMNGDVVIKTTGGVVNVTITGEAGVTAITKQDTMIPVDKNVTDFLSDDAYTFTISNEGNVSATITDFQISTAFTNDTVSIDVFGNMNEFGTLTANKLYSGDLVLEPGATAEVFDVWVSGDVGDDITITPVFDTGKDSNLNHTSNISLGTVIGSISQLNDELLQIVDAGNGMFDLSFVKNPSRLEVYDLNGRMIYSLNEPGSKHLLDLSAKSNGVYILNVITESGTATAKVSVNN
jgi:hypothetical protein